MWPANIGIKLIGREVKPQVLCVQEGKQRRTWFVGERSGPEHMKDSGVGFVAGTLR